MSLYNEFLDAAWERGIGQYNQPKHLRTGQMYYDLLSEFYPHIAKRLIETHMTGVHVDPYSNDNNLPRFFEFVKAELEKEEA